jgi:hypothetical protein
MDFGDVFECFFEPSYISPTHLWKFQIKKLLKKEGPWSEVFNGKNNVNVESSTSKPLVISQATWNICYWNNNDNTKCSTICSCHYKYNTNLSLENLGFGFWVCLKYVTRLKSHNGHVLKRENVEGNSKPLLNWGLYEFPPTIFYFVLIIFCANILRSLVAT